MPSRALFCTCALLVALIFKFWLVSGLEITDDPDDPPNYIARMLEAGPSLFGIGTGIFGWALREVDIPFRLGIEAAYLTACMLVVRALFDWPARSPLALGLYLIAVFNPAFAELCSHVMSDQVWLVETLAGLALFVAFAGTHRGYRWLLLALGAGCLGLANITRMTLIPLLAAVAVWAVIFGAIFWLKHKKPRRDFLTPAGWIAALAVALAIYYATCFHNYSTFGYFGASLPDSREFQKFYMTLQSVGDADGDTYYPVSDARLSLVARAGPSSQWFVDQMRTDDNFRNVSQQHYGKYDFALGWFPFVVFFNTMPEHNLRAGMGVFNDVEQEIARANFDNRIKVRSILPLPDCRLGIVARALPSSFNYVGSLATYIPSAYAYAWNAQEPRFDDASFTDALTRRGVSADRLSLALGAALCWIYRPLYLLVLPVLVFAVMAVVVLGLRGWRNIPPLSFHFVAQQFFAVFGVAVFLWYALFDASGVMCEARYVIYLNVMLPLLAAYYLLMARRLWRKN